MADADAPNNHRHGQWSGLFKLTEEMGEALQVCGKIAAFPDGDEHPDGAGSLRVRLETELADVIAAIAHVIDVNGLDAERIGARAERKEQMFKQWMTI